MNILLRIWYINIGDMYVYFRIVKLFYICLYITDSYEISIC